MSPRKPQPFSSYSTRQHRPVAYRCAVCGGVVDVGEGGVQRFCDHDGAGVEALLSATATGEARVAS